MPKVSFIIPFFNNGSTIAETVESVFGQSFIDFDVWIIDDGSTDAHSLEELKKLESRERITVLRQQNAGPSVARNLAIKQTTAEIIVPLDADDRIKPDALAKGLSFFADEKVGVVYGDNLFFGARNEMNLQEQFDIRKAILYNQVALCSFIRKAVFDKSGYFDEYMSKRGLEDWEFWIRITEDGWLMQHVPDVFFEIRVRPESRTYEVANKNLEDLMSYVYKKHIKVVMREYEKLFYAHKMLGETPDYKIGGQVLAPYRMLKKIFKS